MSICHMASNGIVAYQSSYKFSLAFSAAPFRHGSSPPAARHAEDGPFLSNPACGTGKPLACRGPKAGAVVKYAGGLLCCGVGVETFI